MLKFFKSLIISLILLALVFNPFFTSQRATAEDPVAQDTTTVQETVSEPQIPEIPQILPEITEPQAPEVPETPEIPGRIEGTGTNFSVTDSKYLNITLDSIEPIKLKLESVPEMITLEVEPASEATSTEITLTGFAPLTTYHKYEDDYHNHTSFTPDENGKYSYTQDISQKHLVFIQPRASTIFLSDSGWSNPAVGTWDSATKTAALTQDVTETIQIDSNNIILDGNGHFVTGANTGIGVYLPGRTGVTVKNLNVRNFGTGIYLSSSGSNTLTNNTTSYNNYGIFLNNNSNSNTLTSNAANSNGYYGIYLGGSNSNTLTSNTASNNRYGIFLYSNSNRNTLTSNTVNSSTYGILLYGSSNSNTLIGNTTNSNTYGILLWSSTNTLTNNTANSNNRYGIYLYGFYGSSNTLTNNTASNNTDWGIYLLNSSSNTLTNNTANSNNGGIYLDNSSSNTLTNNTMTGNSYNFHVDGTSDAHFDNNIDTTNLVDSKPIYYIKNATSGTFDSSTNVGTLYLINSSNIIVRDLNLTKNGAAVFLWKTQNSRIENVTASSNAVGIYLKNSSSNTLTNNTASSNWYGIYLYGSAGNTLTDNTMTGNRYNFHVDGTSDAHFDNNIDTTNLVDSKPVYYIKNATSGTFDSSTNIGTLYLINSSNIIVRDLNLTKNYAGVFLWKTQNSRIENVTASNNGFGIYLKNSSSNTLTNNTTNSNNSYGILLSGSAGNTLTSNAANSNGYAGIYLYGSNSNTLTNNTANSNWVVYEYGSGIHLYNSSNNTLTNNTASSNFYGIHLYNSSNSNTLTNNTTSYNFTGPYLHNSSSSNTLTNNTVYRNYSYGITLENSSNSNTITGNTISYSIWGVTLWGSSSNNKVYNNNIISNQIQARVEGGTGNVFNLAAPTGGNYWSNWTTPDANNDGFVDNPYVFGGGQDNLPWTKQNGWLLNRPPVAEAGGPYVGDEASPINFDGSASTDADGTIVSYEWDWDNDGVYDESSTLPTTTHLWADDFSGLVGLRVTDNKGVQSSDTAQVTVNNVAPSASINSVSQPNPLIILPGDVLTFTGSFTDSGWPDTHTASWDFGDGTIIPGPLTEENLSPDSTGASTVTHAYLAPGTYLVTLTITDDDGGVGKATVSVRVLSATDSVIAINNYIQALPDSAFVNNPDQRKNAFAQKLAEVQALIDAGLYGDAINKLQNDILMKVDGFIDNKPDLDWVVDEPAQRDLYYAILALVSYLQGL